MPVLSEVDNNEKTNNEKTKVALCDEVLVDIFRRLPFHALMRLCFVSRRFQDLVTGPALQRALPRSAVHGVLILTNASHCHYHATTDSVIHSILSLSLRDAMSGHSDLDVLDSCNGLLLYRTFSKAFSPGTIYNLYNVATRQNLVLPHPTLVASVDVAGIAFDPRRSRHFKIVVVSVPVKSRRIFEVYSSERANWFKPRASVDVAYSLPVLPPRKPVFVDGKLHFEVLPGRLLTFDFQAERLDTVNWRPWIEPAWQRYGDSMGRLYRAEYDGSRLELRVWRMEEAPPPVWTLTCSMAFPPSCTVQGFHPDVEGYVFVRCFDSIFACHLHGLHEAVEIARLGGGRAGRKEGEIYPIVPNFLYSFPRPDRWWLFSPRSR